MQETQEMRIQSLVWGDPLEEGRETHSGILAWRMDSEHWQAIVCGVAESDMTEHTPTMAGAALQRAR